MENSAKKVTGGASSPLKQGLRAKDLIALGVFGLIYFVATMLVMGVLSMSVVGFLVAPAVSSILAGIVWTYLRVPHRNWLACRSFLLCRGFARRGVQRYRQVQELSLELHRIRLCERVLHGRLAPSPDRYASILPRHA